MVIVLMGVKGAGKTTIGTLLAERLGWKFADADSFHPAANVQKIHQGIPLDDSDREPWLNALSAAITGWITQKENVVLACSALKRAYRTTLGVEASREVKVVYLKGAYDLIYQRLTLRHEHFATEAILASQFADLEEPQDATASDPASTIVVDVGHPLREIVAEIQVRLNLAS
ncbi:MAG: gluconokinase [Acidobacteriaceae bacterium]